MIADPQAMMSLKKTEAARSHRVETRALRLPLLSLPKMCSPTKLPTRTYGPHTGAVRARHLKTRA